MTTLGKGEVFKQIVEDFAAAGYTIYHKLLSSEEYGVTDKKTSDFSGSKK